MQAIATHACLKIQIRSRKGVFSGCILIESLVFNVCDFSQIQHAQQSL
ncbi:hypothetical protein J500_3314 [Acinetobacter sp. 479375]|nr:hypothetical protein J500_3314 [Acinetobacter sp. 479375]BBF77094.1 hypothetical protein URS_1068 [Acinetobacter ursingii]